VAELRLDVLARVFVDLLVRVAAGIGLLGELDVGKQVIHLRRT
jgi:hypothetical protein